MQSETILLLIFIFIILIAVSIIGILYFIHTSKYDESNTFYKNLLELIKKNPNLSNDLEDKLFKKDFDIDDISDSQKELSNIFGAKIYSEAQLSSLNQANTNYVDAQLSNYPLTDSREYKYLVNSYSVINDNNDLSNIYNNPIHASRFTSNLDLSYTFFEGANNINDKKYMDMITDFNTINTSNTRYDRILGDDQQLNNLYSFYSINGNEISLNDAKTFKINISKLKLCDGNNCSNLNFDAGDGSITVEKTT